MKEQKLFDAITNLPDEIIAEAAFTPPRKKRLRKWHIPAVAAVLALCFFLGSVLWPDGATLGMVANAAYLAEYPERVRAVDYGAIGYDKASEALRKERLELRLSADFDRSGLDGFTKALTQQLLGENESQNRVFSPINVYMALSVLAETAGADSRQQILDILGESSIDTLRGRANSLWNNVYRDDGKTKTLLANSLWLRADTKYSERTLKTIAENYYASTFFGEMGSSKLDSALRDWMNKNTENFLSDQIEGVKLDPDAVMTVVSTVYYKGVWSKMFSSAKNTSDVFHATDGDREVTFMNESRDSTYYWSDNFVATYKSLSQGGMWLVLPDEGVTPEELLYDDSFWNMVQGGSSVERKAIKIDLSVPKFDISDEADLIDSLKALGVSNVFDMEKADFSPLTKDWDMIWVNKVVHGARLKIDEEGAEGAAYVKVTAPGAAPPLEDRVELKLDRPFVFVLTNSDNIPLFVGIVHNPQ